MAIKEFPEEIRRELGKAIYDLQKGEMLKLPLSRRMSAVANGVEEIRLKDRHSIYRAFYFARLSDRIIIFHAFIKKTQKTPKHDIDLGKKRLKEVLNEKA